tara:strand:- start:14 stop:724 length:711 start_codon:yes stop_codon:yes gene_type:complete
MKKLIVSGCSWGDDIFFSQFHPDMDCNWPKWPILLANKLNMECVNLCKCGAGQEYIYSSISDYIQKTRKEDIGLVIAAWSTAPRRCYQMKTYWRNDRQDVNGDIIYWIDRSIRYNYAFQNLMEQEKLNYIQVQMISLYKGHIWEINKKEMGITNEKTENIMLGEEYKKLKDKALGTIKNTKYKFNDKHINWPTDETLGGSTIESLLEDKHRISELDRHPNKIGQERIAELIYDRLG